MSRLHRCGPPAVRVGFTGRTLSLLLVAMLLLVAAVDCSSSSSSSLRPDPSASLKAILAGEAGVVLEDALHRVLAETSHPGQLRSHLEQALAAAELPPPQSRAADSPPSLLAAPGASDCTVALARMAGGLAARELWAIQMVDASSKLVTGVLYGNLADLGNYDECVSAAPGRAPGEPGEPVAEAGGFTGRYALVSLDVQTAVQPDEDDSLLAASGWKASLAVGNSSDNATTDYSTLLTVRMAVCVPSPCGPPLLEAALGAALARTDGPLQAAGLRLRARVPERTSSVAGRWRPMRQVDWAVIFVCVGLVVLVILASTVDIVLGDEDKGARRRAAALLAFSAWTNGRRLLAPAAASDSTITCINGIRFLSALWVILGHRYMYALYVPFSNLAIIPKRVEDVSAMAVASAPLSVDTFFTIGGMVNCYAFMKASRGRRSYNWIMYYVHRYLRLTPAFALMIAVTATWLSLLGGGPLWAEQIGSAEDNCRKNWWSAVLYVSNYLNPNDPCMMQSWYLMVDMQLHWLSPLLLIPLWKWGRLGLGWLGSVVLLSCAVPFALTYAFHFRTPVSTDLRPEAQRRFTTLMYTPTHTRFTSYVCGTLAGYLLYLLKSKQLSWRPSRVQVLAGWLVASALCATVVFGVQPLFDTEHHPYDVLEASFYMGFYRLAWAVGLAWIVMACVMGHGGPVNALLSWAPFNVLGRLTYGIYLTHAAQQVVSYGSMRTSEYYSDFRMAERMMSDALISIFLGLCLCLVMESPISALEKLLLHPSPRGPKPSPSAAGEAAAAATTPGAAGPATGKALDPEKGEQLTPHLSEAVSPAP